MKRFNLIIAALAVFGIAITMQAQTLTHSYDFSDLPAGNVENNTPIVNQATGAADATLYLVKTGSATVNANGSLTLNGVDANIGAYIQLPNDVIGGKSAITIESTVTPNGLLNFSRVFDFGGSSDASRFFLALSSGTSGKSYTHLQAVGGTEQNSQLAIGNNYHLTVTKDNSALRYYINGALTGTYFTNMALSTCVGNENFIGNSHWGGDSLVSASIDNFNIYDAAMGATEIKARAILAADTEGKYNVTATLSAAQKLDNLISQALGYWGFSSYNRSAYDLSPSNRNLTVETNDSCVVNGADPALAGSLATDGMYLHETPSVQAFATTNSGTLTNLGGAGAFTISTRINMDSFKTGQTSEANGNYDDFIRAGARGNASTNYSLAAYNGELVFYCNTSDGQFKTFYLVNNDNTHFTLDTGKWYDLTAIFDPGVTGVNDTSISLYAYDPTTGDLLASYVHDNLDFDSLRTGGASFLLMEVPWNDHGNSDGYMDFAGAWNTILSPEQIAALSGLAAKANAAVPEPSTWTLLILSAVGLMFFRRKK